MRSVFYVCRWGSYDQRGREGVVHVTYSAVGRCRGVGHETFEVAGRAPNLGLTVKGGLLGSLVERAHPAQEGTVDSDAPIWQEPVRGGATDLAVLGLPGIEALRLQMQGVCPRPPSARLTGRRLVSVEPGRVTCSMPASPWLVGPKGRLHTGSLAFLADAPLFYAVHSAMPANVVSTTAEFSLTFLGEAPAVGGELIAEGHLVHADARNALSEVFISDSTGRMVAHGTSRCFVFPPANPPRDPEAQIEAWSEPDYEVPDPWERRPQGAALAPELFETVSGLEILQRQLAGELASPPINHLTGMRIVAVEKGTIAFSLPLSGWVTNELGAVFGGAIGLLAKSATAAAVQTIAPTRTTFTALDLKVNLVRSPAVDGTDLLATGKVVHRGRLAIATSEIVDAKGRVVAIATGSTSVERS